MSEKQSQIQYSPKDKAEVFRQYTQERTTIKEIAVSTSVSEAAIKYWIKSGKWKDKKTEIQKTLIENATSEFMEHIGKERIKTARGHLEVSRLIRNAIKEKFGLDSDGKKRFISDKQLAILAKALKDCTDVEARAAGLGDKAPDFLGGGGQGQVGPVVVVGLQPTPVTKEDNHLADNDPMIIDVTGDVTEMVQKKACPFA